MVDLNKCNPIPVSAPLLTSAPKSKSASVLSIGGLWFFVTDTDVSRGYSIDLGLQICIFDTKAKTLNMIARRISDIKSIDPTVMKRYQQYAINRKNNRSRFNKLKKGTYIWTK